MEKLRYNLYFRLLFLSFYRKHLLEVFLSLLKSSISERKSQRGGDPTIHREKILLWDALIKICGDEDKVNSLIEKIAEDEELRNKDYMELAIKYKNGYRHKKSMNHEDDLDEF